MEISYDKKADAMYIEFRKGEFVRNRKIDDFAINQGMVTMQQDGLLKVINGVTTIEEVEKVTGPLE